MMKERLLHHKNIYMPPRSRGIVKQKKTGNSPHLHIIIFQATPNYRELSIPARSRTMATYQPVPGTLSLDNTPSSTWRPWPLRQWFLISFPVLCALLCITIEVIIQGCHGGCHVFGQYSATDHSWMTSFSYSQMPTILSLALNLLWALPHHNVMRLEPYFRMSTPGGATAEDSIFLQYPYIFPVYVPYKAMKRRLAVYYNCHLCIAVRVG